METIILFVIIGFGFWVMLGGLNRRPQSTDEQIRDIQRQLDELKRRR